MDSESACTFLDWDSNFFGYRIARLVPRRLDEAIVFKAFNWCRENHIDCLYLLIESNDAATVRQVEGHQCHFVDIRVTYHLDLTDFVRSPAFSDPGKPIIRDFNPKDLASLEAIAQNSHTDSRFYYDPCFSPEQCNQLYATWIRNSCQGLAQKVLVAELERRPVGYLTGHSQDAENTIGLFGVAQDVRGMGVGSSLLQAGLCWFAGRQGTTVSVVTQGRNVNAHRLYQQAGFRIESVELWYHRWFKGSCR
jgi:dTDP-4-amino-4,6-dideoxy-D-galactose acyltransferase